MKQATVTLLIDHNLLQSEFPNGISKEAIVQALFMGFDAMTTTRFRVFNIAATITSETQIDSDLDEEPYEDDGDDQDEDEYQGN